MSAAPTPSAAPWSHGPPDPVSPSSATTGGRPDAQSPRRPPLLCRPRPSVLPRAAPWPLCSSPRCRTVFFTSCRELCLLAMAPRKLPPSSPAASCSTPSSRHQPGWTPICRIRLSRGRPLHLRRISHRGKPLSRLCLVRIGRRTCLCKSRSEPASCTAPSSLLPHPAPPRARAAPSPPRQSPVAPGARSLFVLCPQCQVLITYNIPARLDVH